MRVVCLVRDEPALRYFVNRVHKAHGVDLIVVEDPHLHRTLIGRTLDHATREGAGAKALAEAMRVRTKARRQASRHQATLERQFGGLSSQFAPDVPSVIVGSVNDDAVVRRVRELERAVVLDHGTSLVGEPVLSQAEMTLNVHWGLSPYYRGVRCTEWALIMWDPANIGVTVHELSPDIDGGAIAGQKRATVSHEDTVHSINMQLTYLGTEIVVEVLRRVAAGEEIRLVQQDLSEGVLTSARQWSSLLSRHVERIERDGMLARMLESPSREPQPIVSLSSTPRATRTSAGDAPGHQFFGPC